MLLALSLAAVPANLPAQSNLRVAAITPLLVVRGAEHPVQVASLAVTTEVNGRR